MGWLSRLSLESGFACRDFPARRNEFPVPDHRESVATTAERLRNLGAESARRVQFRRISLYFPCRSGKRQQRRVRSRLPPPPFSLRVQRLPVRTPAQPEKSPRFRGVLAAKPSRIRTGDCGFRARKTAPPVFISVAKLGGSVSPPIRLLCNGCGPECHEAQLGYGQDLNLTDYRASPRPYRPLGPRHPYYEGWIE